MTANGHRLGQLEPSVELTLSFHDLTGELGAVHVREGSQPHVKAFLEKRQVGVFRLAALGFEVVPSSVYSVDNVRRDGRLHGITVRGEKVKFASSQVNGLIETQRRQDFGNNNLSEDKLQVDWVANNGSENEKLFPLRVAAVGIVAGNGNNVGARFVAKDAIEKAGNANGAANVSAEADETGC